MKKDLKKLAALAVALTLVLSTILPAFALASLPERYLNGEADCYKRFRRIFFGTDDEVSTYDEAAFLERVHMLWDKEVQELRERSASDYTRADIIVTLYLTDEASKREEDYTPDDFPEIDIQEVYNSHKKNGFVDIWLKPLTVTDLYEIFYILADRDDTYCLEMDFMATPDEPIEPVEPEPTEPALIEPEPTDPDDPTEPEIPEIPILFGDLIGDLNGDGDINAQDRIILSRHLARWTGYETIITLLADLNKDGKADAKDRIILTRHLAKWQGYEIL